MAKRSIRFGPAAGFAYDALERQLLREAMEWARGMVVARIEGRSLVAESMLTAKHAESVKTFAADNSIDLSSVDVVGFHGQTVIHRPERRLTVQLGDGTALSDALGVPVVYDFGPRIWKHGGQGAPLVPIFHRALACREKLEMPAAFVNIGGIANVTFVPEGPAEGLIAFDAGAGNCLLDDWAMRHTGEPIDRDAKLALSGTVNRETLTALLSHPYFSAPLPKSLDRSAFCFEPLES